MTLREALDAAAADQVGIEVRQEGGRTEWLVAGQVFAAIDGDTAEYRLDPAVARAALGTPDTAPLPRGPEWVAFRPPVLDQMAVDRATAWFASAARRAGSRRDQGGATRADARP
jgi:hypothetical protein